MKKSFGFALAALALAGVSSLALAQTALSPADAAAYRHAQFRRVGDAFKAVNDGVRASQPDLAVIRANAASLVQLSEAQPTWFPAGSGPESGVRTRAKAEIWTNSVVFTERMNAFRAAAQALASASAGGDLDAIRAQTRALGGRCAACHTDFRTPEV
jgi:cytochrome c556